VSDVSLGRLEEHREIWRTKPVLADIYAIWFRALLARTPSGARVLEVGAGPGFLAEYARQHRPDVSWVATDVIKAPWVDLVADGLRLPIRGGRFDVVAVLDLVHHLARPAAFFQESARVLAPGGRICAIEPWITPLSYPVYRFFHQEELAIDRDPWNPFGAAESRDKQPFDGASAGPWRLVRDTPRARWEELGFDPPSAVALNGFAYLLSLGFRRRSLIGRRPAAWLMRLDARTQSLAPYLGLRALLQWTRRS
jgi:SAM-dependent methyltransferase